MLHIYISFEACININNNVHANRTVKGARLIMQSNREHQCALIIVNNLFLCVF
jgi:hypothetical protein